MENKNIHNDDVERIVNDTERQARIFENHKKEKLEYQRKILVNAISFLIASLVCGLLSCIGLMAPVLALTAVSICGLYAAFLFGRWFENAKKWGWK